MLVAGLQKAGGVGLGAVQQIKELTGPWQELKVGQQSVPMSGHSLICPQGQFITDLQGEFVSNPKAPGAGIFKAIYCATPMKDGAAVPVGDCEEVEVQNTLFTQEG